MPRIDFNPSSHTFPRDGGRKAVTASAIDYPSMSINYSPIPVRLQQVESDPTFCRQYHHYTCSVVNPCSQYLQVYSTVQAFNNRPGDGLTAYFPMWLTRNENGKEDVVFPLDQPQRIALDTTEAEVSVAFRCTESYDAKEGYYTLSDSSWVSVGSTELMTGSNDTFAVRDYRFNLSPNNTLYDRTQTVTFYLKTGSANNNVLSSSWQFTQPGALLDYHLIKTTPYVIQPSSDGRVPGLDLTDAFVAWNKNFLGAVINTTISQSKNDGFHKSTVVSGYATDNVYRSASLRTQWDRNLYPYPRTGSVTIRFMSGSIDQSVTWRIEQPAFISKPTVSLAQAQETYSLEANQTSLVVPIQYYMGSTGSAVRAVTYTGTTAWSLTATSASQSTSDELVMQYYYTFSFAANSSTSARYKVVSFSIQSGSSLANRDTKTIRIEQKGTTPGNVRIIGGTSTIGALGGTADQRVEYEGYPTWSVLAPTTSLTLQSRTTNVEEPGLADYTYAFLVPQNTSTSPRTFPVTFSLQSGSKILTQSTTITQLGAAVPGDLVVRTESVNCSAAGETVDTTVEYHGYPTWSIGNISVSPSMTGVSYQELYTETGLAIRKYFFPVPANPNTTPRTYTATFRMTSGSQTKTGTFVINQLASVPVPGNLTVDPVSSSVGSAGGVVSIVATYEGYPTWNVNPVTASLQGTAEQISSTDNSITYRYTFTVPANSQEQPVDYTIGFSMTSGSSTSISSSAIINQAAYVPGNPQINISVVNPYTVSAQGLAQTIPVSYVDAGGPANTSASIDQGGEGVVPWIFLDGATPMAQEDPFVMQYAVRVNVNNVSQPRSGSIEFMIKSEGQVVTSSILNIYQDPAGEIPPSGEPSVELSKYSVDVAATTRITTVNVYFNNKGDYIINPPSCSTGVTTSINDTAIEGTTERRYYSITFPVNTGNNTIERSVYFSMTSGSDNRGAVLKIYQAGQSSVVSGISLSEYVQNIAASQTSSQVVATYAGVSDITRVAPPSSSVPGWTYELGGYQREGGNITAVWILKGTANTGVSTRQIVYRFRVTGLAQEATLVIYQEGTGDYDDQGIRVIPAWRDTEVALGGNFYKLTCKNSQDGPILFQDNITKAPDKDFLEVNFNRIAESFIEPRDLYSNSTLTPYFRLLANLEGNGEALQYDYRVTDDWSYTTVGTSTAAVKSRPLQKEVILGGYMVYTIAGGNNTNYQYTLVRNGVEDLSTQISSTPYNYLDLIYQITECGEYSILQNHETVLTTWTVVDADYQIIFLNEFGGWDSFVVKGPVVPLSNIARNNFQSFRRRTSTYQNNVTKRYNVSTGILTDEISPVVTRILGSPKLYLIQHNIPGGTTTRGTNVRGVTDSVEERTFKNQGRQFAVYQFDLEEEETKIRR